MKSFVRFSVTLLLFLTILSGCSKPYQNPLITPPNQTFKGIEALLSESGAVSLISIHGMCHHGTGWIKANRDRFGEFLGMVGADLLLIFDGGAAGVKAYRTDLTRGDGMMVRLYGILFSDVTLPEKQRELCRDVSHENDVCPKELITYARKRASFNETLKNKLLNDCLADAASYLGPAGAKIRSGVLDALITVMTDIRENSRLRKGPLLFISESLGSKVLGDSLLCAPNDVVWTLLPELSRTSHVVLGANQIPLLNLGFKESPCDTKGLYEKLLPTGAPLPQIRRGNGGVVGLLDLIEAARFNASRQEGRPPQMLRDAPPESLAVVAFTDPNDLLGYEISPEDVGGLKVINIIVSNDATWFGFLENPLQAHEGLRENRAVIELLRCGHDPDSKYACPASP